MRSDTEHEKAWRETAAKTKVDGPLPITFEIIAREHHPHLAIRGTLTTRELVSNEEARVYQERSVPPGLPPDPALFLQVAEALYLHECQEWISCAGHRFADPHRHERPAPFLSDVDLKEAKRALRRATARYTRGEP